MQGSVEAPKAPLGNNARPLQPLHHRTVRTNIDFQNAKVGDSPSVLESTYSYCHLGDFYSLFFLSF